MILQKKIAVQNIYDNIRIDRWLKKIFPSLTQSFIEKNIRQGVIKVNNKKTKSNFRVFFKDIVTIDNFKEEKYVKKEAKKKNKKIPKKINNYFSKSILFESSNFMIIRKWDGISTQGGLKTGISINDIIKNVSLNYNLVHRLDQDTSGLLIIAKDYLSTKVFSEMFKNKKINKYYLAICQGIPTNAESVVKLSLRKKNKNTYYDTITKYKVIKKIGKLSLIIFKPITGKTHQIRIVSKHIKCPIVGDNKYNQSKLYSKEKLKLNAYFLNFIFNNKNYDFISNIPDDMKKFMKVNKLNTSTNLINKLIEII